MIWLDFLKGGVAAFVAVFVLLWLQARTDSRRAKSILAGPKPDDRWLPVITLAESRLMNLLQAYENDPRQRPLGEIGACARHVAKLKEQYLSGVPYYDDARKDETND